MMFHPSLTLRASFASLVTIALSMGTAAFVPVARTLAAETQLAPIATQSLPGNPHNSASSKPGASLSSRDKTFIQKALESGIAEVEAGKLAATGAGSDGVKDFAKQMVEDHTRAGNDLREIAQIKAVKLIPTAPNNAHKALLLRLQSAKPAAFDKRYISDAAVKEHKAAVALFSDEAQNGHDLDVKSFAMKDLPMIQNHYQMAQDLARSAPK